MGLNHTQLQLTIQAKVFAVEFKAEFRQVLDGATVNNILKGQETSL
jgi:hypothetical protein